MKILKTCTLAALFLCLLSSCQQDNEDLKKNVVPVAEAGAPITITLPVKTFNLTGVASDADGSVVGYLWSQLSGPSIAEISNPASVTTLVTANTKGTYVFQFMAVDNEGATGIDTVSVTVLAPLQQTLTLQPANSTTEKMIVNIGGNDQSFVGSPEYVVDAWSVSSSPYVGRALFKFDMSTIPANSEIVSAHLYLYSSQPPYNGNLTNANYGSNNAVYLQQVTSDWSAASANWFNQPSVNTTTQISIPHTALSSLDLDLDVKTLVASQVAGTANYGFMLKLQQEVAFTSRAFISSYETNKADKHPKLVVVYK